MRKVELRDANDRAAFVQEVQTIFQALAQKYGKQEGGSAETKTEVFKLMLVCYPLIADDE